jgi:hypothetical protein
MSVGLCLSIESLRIVVLVLICVYNFKPISDAVKLESAVSSDN